MVSTLALLGVLLVTLLVSIVIWRTMRRVPTVGYLKDVSVSREWLLQHQGVDER